MNVVPISSAALKVAPKADRESAERPVWTAVCTISHAEVPMDAVRAAGWGIVAGLAGVAAMTAAEKIEQQFTEWPNSYVPARTLVRLIGRLGEPGSRGLLLNWSMH